MPKGTSRSCRVVLIITIGIAGDEIRRGRAAPYHSPFLPTSSREDLCLSPHKATLSAGTVEVVDVVGKIGAGSCGGQGGKRC